MKMHQRVDGLAHYGKNPLTVLPEIVQLAGS